MLKSSTSSSRSKNYLSFLLSPSFKCYLVVTGSICCAVIPLMTVKALHSVTLLPKGGLSQSVQEEDLTKAYFSNPFQAALLQPRPWLPGIEISPEAHQQIYSRFLACLRSPRLGKKCREILENERRTDHDDYLESRFTKLTVARERGQISFPARWLDNFDTSVLRESETLGTTYALKAQKSLLHVMTQYKLAAWGKDMLKPLSGTGSDSVGLALLLVESLGTLWITGVYDLFYEAAEWITKYFALLRNCQTDSFFEMTIRVLGGLVSAASLSGHRGLIATAELLGRRYLRSFGLAKDLGCPWNVTIRPPSSETTPSSFTGQNEFSSWEGEEARPSTCYARSTSPLHLDQRTRTAWGLPPTSIDFCNGARISKSFLPSSLAQAGSFQLEFVTLSALTGDFRYKELAERTLQRLQEIARPQKKSEQDFLYLPRPQLTGNDYLTGTFTIGAEADSYVEYLLKLWLLTDKPELLALWNGAVDDVLIALYASTDTYAPLVKTSARPALRLDVDKIPDNLTNLMRQCLSPLKSSSNIPIVTNRMVQKYLTQCWNDALSKANVTLPAFKTSAGAANLTVTLDDPERFQEALYHAFTYTLQYGTPLEQLQRFTADTLWKMKLEKDLSWYELVHEHLACFFPGSLILGAASQWNVTWGERVVTDTKKRRDVLRRLIIRLEENASVIQDLEWRDQFRLLSIVEFAMRQTDTCVRLYALHSDIGFETMRFDLSSDDAPSDQRFQKSATPEAVKNVTASDSTKKQPASLSQLESLSMQNTSSTSPTQPKQHVHIRKSNPNSYHLRPETIESLFYLHYYTGDPKYRRQGAALYDALEQHLKTSTAYAAVAWDTKGTMKLLDEMESFFVAETLKYFFLLFAPPEFMDLSQYVFTTEAHPVPVLSKDYPTTPLFDATFWDNYIIPYLPNASLTAPLWK